MSDFEWALTSALNSFFEREGIAAIAYRLKQSRFASQLVDILVDSAASEYYLAIECKSLDARKARSLYFTQHFSSAGGHQITRETEFITRSGRKGILAVELRHGVGKARTAHFVPWGQVYELFLSGRPGLNLDEIRANPALERRGGAYELSRLDIVRISGYQDIASNKDIAADHDIDSDPEMD
jgi:Holliday junction resolvase